MAGNGNLTTKQVKALAALLQVGNVKAAADAAGCGERTLHRWLEQPHFQAALAAAESAALEQAARRLAGLTGQALDTLQELLETGDPGIRLRAALGILDKVRVFRELADLEGRIAELEAELEGGNGREF